MDNPQDIHWFSGFFEGEGCFTFRLRNRRGSIQGKLIEPKISLCNTNRQAIDKCLGILAQQFIWPILSEDKRKNRLLCYNLDICSSDACYMFCKAFRPYIECDRERLDLMLKFVSIRQAYKEHSQYEWELYNKLSQWRSSETTCEITYTISLDWLVGIIEAEGGFDNHSWTGQPSIYIANTNPSIIKKSKLILQSIGINPHIKDYPKVNPNHQIHWVLTIHGQSKVRRFIDAASHLFRYLSEELYKLKI